MAELMNLASTFEVVLVIAFYVWGIIAIGGVLAGGDFIITYMLISCILALIALLALAAFMGLTALGWV
jgi:hypothetical protein